MAETGGHSDSRDGLRQGESRGMDDVAAASRRTGLAAQFKIWPHQPMIRNSGSGISKSAPENPTLTLYHKYNVGVICPLYALRQKLTWCARQCEATFGLRSPT
jgi:hypothetical protein